MITIAQMFRIKDALTLSHTSRDPATGPDPIGDPAVLVIPRNGSTQEPHLVILATPPLNSGLAPGTLVAVDEHIITSTGELDNDPWSEIADVLVYEGRWPTKEGMTDILSHHPGCEVAVMRRPKSFLVGLGNGQAMEIAGQPTGQNWAYTYGSFLHCWICSHIPLTILNDAVIIAGRYDTTRNEHGHEMAISGRMDLRPLPALPTRRAAQRERLQDSDPASVGPAATGFRTCRIPKTPSIACDQQALENS